MKDNQITPNLTDWKDSYRWQMEAYPFFCSVYHKLAKAPKNRYYDSWNFLNFFHDGQLIAFEPKKTLNLKGEMAIKELLDGKDDFLILVKEVHKETLKMIEKCLQVREQDGFMDFDGWWPELQNTLSDISSILFPFDFTLNDKMKEWEAEDNPIFKILNEEISAGGDSFFNEAEKEAIKIKKESKNPEEAYNQFIKEFGWIQNSYAGTKKPSREWVDDFIDAAKQDENKQSKKENIIVKHNFLIETAVDGIAFRDDKKKLLLIGVELMEKWLEAVCQQNSWKFEELRWLSMGEILLLLQGEKKYLTMAERYARENKRIGIMSEIGYVDIDEDFFKKVAALQLEGIDLQEIKGLSGNKGCYKGIARIITDIQKEGENLKIGDVLVTSMTRPEYLSLMKKAGAFVTDEGGITCHAAIIAREMKKPCIIGTKIATQVLKDGDLVEVDADKGIVRIIEKVK